MSQMHMKDFEDAFVVYVFGHIDMMEPDSKTMNSIDLFWDHLSKVAAGKRIVMLTSLARGADCLVVRRRPEGTDYYAVLPFDQTEYEEDFIDHDGTTEALDMFREAIREACSVITCPARKGDYSRAADFSRRHADIILTMWDGWESLTSAGEAKKGGTYDQIRKSLRMEADPIESGKDPCVVNIRVRRKGKHEAWERNMLEQAPDFSPEILLWNNAERIIETRPFSTWDPTEQSMMRAPVGINREIRA